MDSRNCRKRTFEVDSMKAYNWNANFSTTPAHIPPPNRPGAGGDEGGVYGHATFCCCFDCFNKAGSYNFNDQQQQQQQQQQHQLPQLPQLPQISQLPHPQQLPSLPPLPPRIKTEPGLGIDMMGMGMGIDIMAMAPVVRMGEEVYMDSSNEDDRTEGGEPYTQQNFQPTPVPSPQYHYQQYQQPQPQQPQPQKQQQQPQSAPRRHRSPSSHLLRRASRTNTGAITRRRISSSSSSVSSFTSDRSSSYSSTTSTCSSTSPTSTPPRSPSNAITRQEMEMLYERVTSVAHKEWGQIVKDINAAFGNKRRPDNVRTHWNMIAKQKLLAMYR